MPTIEHFPVYRKGGGKETVDNVILAHAEPWRALPRRMTFAVQRGSDAVRIRVNKRDSVCRRV
jgi:hypothetical protein